MGKVCGFWGNFNGKIDEGVEIPKPRQLKADFENELGQVYEFNEGSCKFQAGPGDISKCANAQNYRLLCEKILKSPFSKCTIDKSSIIDSCIYDMCVMVDLKPEQIQG